MQMREFRRPLSPSFPLPHIMCSLSSSQPTALPNRDDMSEEEEEEEEGKLKHQESRIFRKIVVEGREEGCLARSRPLAHLSLTHRALSGRGRGRTGRSAHICPRPFIIIIIIIDI